MSKASLKIPVGVLFTCAWILWRDEVTIGDVAHVWARESAHETQAACEQARGVHIAVYRAMSGTGGYEMQGDTFRLEVDGKRIVHTFRCWPDTIDPRKP